MKHLWTLAPLALAAVALPQEKPAQIPKSELPKEALCVVCVARGSGEGAEKVAAGVRYKGKTYFFCNAKEVAEFRKDPEGFVPLEIPGPAPKVSLTTMAGERTTLDKLGEGKWLLVDFWATWCKPCVDAMPGLSKLHDELKGRSFTLLGVSIDEGGAAKVKPFLTRRPVTYPVVLDVAKQPAWEAFKVKGVPAMFLIDPKGNVVRQWTGKIDEHKLADEVRSLVNAG